MRKLYALLLAFVATVAALAQTQDNAMYVYRNDGGFNAFLREDIDSITLSRFDLDSIEHQTPVCQVFFTPDSIYRIPIEAIDSVSFVPLPTIINSAVFPLTAEHDPYILRGDTLSFEMNLNTPSYLQPSKGNIVVSAVDCNSFENGIIARIVSVKKTSDAIYYNCEKAYIDEIYDQILYHGALQQQESPQTRASATISDVLWNENYDETLSKGGTTTKVHANDVATYQITLRKTLGQPLYAQIQLSNRFESSLDFNAHAEYGNYYQKQIGKTLRVGKICIPEFPLIWFVPTFDFYGYFADEGEINLDFKAHLNRSDKVFMTYDQGFWSITHAPLTDAGVDVASLSMKGYAEVGVIADVLLGLYGSKTGIGMRAEVGIKESIDFKFDALGYIDNGLYDALKDSYARTTIPWKIEVFAQAGLWDGRAPRASYCPLKQEPQWGSDKYILPLFTEPAYTKGADGKTAVLSTSPSRDLLMPVQLGIGVEEKDGEAVATKWNAVKYQKQSAWTLKDLSESFSNLNSGKTYLAYPYIKIMGQELKASPSNEFKIEGEACVDANHVHKVDLGLSVKWACCNVGASSPEQYGGYYAWGETSEKSEYSNRTYQHWVDKNGDGYFDWDEGTITTDIAGTQYDVAHVKWGGSWRMPTRDEIRELVNNCSWQWTTVNGVSGQKVTGPNGNSIFLPAAGTRIGASLDDAGGYGYYWGSTPDESDSRDAFSLYFDSNGSGWGDGGWRYDGFSVRPVSE